MMTTHTNLLLLSVQDNSANMMATHTIYSLMLIVESFSTGANNATNKSENPLLHALFGSAITTAIIHIPSLLLHAQIGSAIMTVLIAQNLLLFFVQNNPAITISSLLLPPVRDNPAITTVTNTNFSLQLIVESLPKYQLNKCKAT